MVKISKVISEPTDSSCDATYKCEVYSISSPCKSLFIAHFDRRHYQMQLIREKLVEALPKELWHDLEELESLNYEEGSSEGYETDYEVGCAMEDEGN